MLDSLNQLNGEDLKTYTRWHLLGFSARGGRYIPVLTFIDGFGLYRNTYCALKGIYITIAGLSWRERKNRANVLPLILGPYGASLAAGIKILQPSLAQLDYGLTVDIGGVPTSFSVFTLAYTGDMKQRMESSGFGSAISLWVRQMSHQEEHASRLDLQHISLWQNAP